MGWDDEFVGRFTWQTRRTVRLPTFGDGQGSRLGRHDSKIFFPPPDGSLIESVLIPASPRALRPSPPTAAPSASQPRSAAPMDANFARAASKDFARNLQPNEIVNQLLAVAAASGERIDNVVFMGMGEPLANLNNLLARHPHHQLALGHRHWRAPHYSFDQRTRAADSENRAESDSSFASPFSCTAPPTKCETASCRSTKTL